MRGTRTFSGSYSVEMPLPFLSSLRGVGDYSEKVVLNRLSVNCSIDMLTIVGCLTSCGKTKLRGVGDDVVGFGIKNFSLSKGGSFSKTFSSEVLSSEVVAPSEHLPFHHPLAVAPLELDQGSKVEHLSFHYPSTPSPPNLDQRYLDLGLPFPTSPP
ncbi:hypothetical protein Tco_0078011 [Tanacetum coccineum]